MSPRVVVLDYGSGNVRSAVRALERVGADVELTADPDAVAAADGLVVPGVGAFSAVMEGLRSVRGDMLVERRLAGGRPVLGICVGLQVMFTAGVESTTDGVRTLGLDQWPGEVKPLDAPVVPHMGWSPVRPPEGTVLFDGIADERFYFVHSYAVLDDPAAGMSPQSRLTPPRVTWAEHGTPFVAAVENGALAATQFHPEKSGDAGSQLLRNWVAALA
ncbi:imidazole glycerol phosphate synthase subunit HisH [Georgenia halophila]|uniref:Imidazole glycerol phosphate synthase subunit HisH n=1 Tax=Georgenia halophila TaxID=620889 RepID=A0ABP8L7B0_9MICO